MENPFELFGQWYAAAQNSGIKEPTAMTLATATKDGVPSARTVLLKSWDEKGFVFYTNATSQKGREMQENPNVCLNFYWMDMQKQIRINGIIEPVKDKEADDYYNSRLLEKRIGAWASKQSQLLPRREELLERIEEFKNQYGDTPPRPDFWHGFRVKPTRIEFWQEGDYRLHQRDIFTREGNGWNHFQIYP